MIGLHFDSHGLFMIGLHFVMDFMIGLHFDDDLILILKMILLLMCEQNFTKQYL